MYRNLQKLIKRFRRFVSGQSKRLRFEADELWKHARSFTRIQIRLRGIQLFGYSNALGKQVKYLTRRIRLAAVFVLWLSLEFPMQTWSLLKRLLPAMDQSSIWRAIFCIAFSLSVIQVTSLVVLGQHPGLLISSLCFLHGFEVHVSGDRGRRWCKRQLGMHPLRTFDPQNPYGGLDLGN